MDAMYHTQKTKGGYKMQLYIKENNELILYIILFYLLMNVQAL